MIRRVVVAAAVVLAAAGAGARAEDGEVTAFVDRWLDAQNRGDFEAYQALYAETFQGVRRSGARAVKLDRAGWLAERQRMFKKRMTVSADERKVEGLQVTFKQTWASGSYRDAGTKQLDLARVDGQLRITREEMLASRRDLGLPGGSRALLVWSAGTPAAVGAAEAGLDKVRLALADAVDFAEGFPQVLYGIDGVRDGEAVLALGLCDAADAGPMLDLFRQLGGRVEARPTRWAGPGKAPGCPTFARDSDSGSQIWSWPGAAASASVGRDTLTVVVLARDEQQLGDFARAFEENLFVAVWRGPGGSVKDVLATRSASDFAQLDELDDDGAAVEASETYVDEPCNGLDRHRYRRRQRTLRFSVKDGAIVQRESGVRTLERGRCSDEEARSFDHR